MVSTRIVGIDGGIDRHLRPIDDNPTREALMYLTFLAAAGVAEEKKIVRKQLRVAGVRGRSGVPR